MQDSKLKILGINCNTTNDTSKAKAMKVISHLIKRELMFKISRNFDSCG